MTHGFFIIMGGFHLFKRSSEEKGSTQSISRDDDDPLHPLLASDLTHDDVYTFTMPTEVEIKDKGKPCPGPNIVVRDAMHCTCH